MQRLAKINQPWNVGHTKMVMISTYMPNINSLSLSTAENFNTKADHNIDRYSQIDTTNQLPKIAV